MLSKKFIGVVLMVGLIALIPTAMRGRQEASTLGFAEEIKADPVTQLTEASNSDGSLILSGTRTVIQDQVKYIFKVSDEINHKDLILYEVMVDKSETFSIPHNSWSSNYELVFLQKNSPQGKDLLVTYATNSDGTGSFAYWFVVGTRKFMNVREL